MEMEIMLVAMVIINLMKNDEYRSIWTTLPKNLSLPLLEVVIMSAMLKIDTFQNFFTYAAYIQIHFRQFPVQILYAKEAPLDCIDTALAAALQIHWYEEGDGDILIFFQCRRRSRICIHASRIIWRRVCSNDG